MSEVRLVEVDFSEVSPETHTVLAPTGGQLPPLCRDAEAVFRRAIADPVGGGLKSVNEGAVVGLFIPRGPSIGVVHVARFPSTYISKSRGYNNGLIETGDFSGWFVHMTRDDLVLLGRPSRGPVVDGLGQNVLFEVTFNTRLWREGHLRFGGQDYWEKLWG